MLPYSLLLLLLHSVTSMTPSQNQTISAQSLDAEYNASKANFRLNSAKKILKDFLHDTPIPKSGPYFDMASYSDNVTGLVGHTTYLHCRVRNLGNETVSWVRHRDIHLLTVGRYTYTSDQRFEAIHMPHSDEWSLRIKYPQKKDSGIYECQISTTPPIGYPIYLSIEEAVTEILRGPDLFIDVGSTINLTCLIEYTPEPPPTITWRHGQEEINFDSPRGGISLVTVKGATTTSRLLIQNAKPEDSGEYSCIPSNSKSSTVRVHILNVDLIEELRSETNWPTSHSRVE
ncbi:zwei Ig domain protein zig-8-like isoform X2 [Planococcus citri]|uniref:zwei Ig domain protein zig-8-like isoform X2 n=1 Tax=Planococcus citri TaxID=170843 RepID=UPI0031F7D182